MAAKVENIVPAKRVVAISFFVDLIDVAINLTVMVLTGSAVLLAESLQGISDLFSVTFVMIGVRRSQKLRDRFHQFGYGRELYFWALLSALAFLFASGIPSLLFGLRRVFAPEPLENMALAYIVLSIAIVTNGYSLFVSSKRLLGGAKLADLPLTFWKSPRVETKVTFVRDLMGASAASVGIVSLFLFALTGNQVFDGIGAALIGVILIVFALLLALGVHDLIIGRSAPIGVQIKIRKIIRSHNEVRKILDFKTMYAGPDTILVSAEIGVVQAMTAKRIEDLVDKIQDEIELSVPEVRFVDLQVEKSEASKKERLRERPPSDY